VNMKNLSEFSLSFAIFDANLRLLDWSQGFAEEFADAAPILAPGVSANDIYLACLLPERALDFSWAAHAISPSPFEYINNRQSVRVTQELSANGCIFRQAQCTSQAPRLHPAMTGSSAELLRSSALQISAMVLKQRNQEKSHLNELALMDGLTGVPNRRYFDELLVKEWQRCKRSQLPLSLIIIDVDFFKRYNDFYGHSQGDVCLKAIADTLKANLKRPGDFVARYGGEEFICLLPEIALRGATQKATDLELAVRALAIPHEKSDALPIVTISLGVATASQVVGDDSSALVNIADQLLYEAKVGGRACVRAASC
jgi:diguanylate cyclase (GGDEF)-like protein